MERLFIWDFTSLQAIIASAAKISFILAFSWIFLKSFWKVAKWSKVNHFNVTPRNLKSFKWIKEFKTNTLRKLTVLVVAVNVIIAVWLLFKVSGMINACLLIKWGAAVMVGVGLVTLSCYILYVTILVCEYVSLFIMKLFELLAHVLIIFFTMFGVGMDETEEFFGDFKNLIVPFKEKKEKEQDDVSQEG